VNRTTFIPVTTTVHPQVSSVVFRTVIYAVALVTGAIVMSFEMLAHAISIRILVTASIPGRK
jgi:hypothetical protein